MKTFTATELTRACQVVATFERNVASFERAQSPSVVAIRAARVIGSWHEIIAAQDALGFEFHQTAAGDNPPCAVRAARAVLEKAEA